jgi:SPP1 family predicted phage head-tail adaptor
VTSKQMPGAGERNNLITFMQPDTGTDEFGQPLGTYSFVGNSWADVRPATTREYTGSRQTEAAIDAVIKLGWRQDIGATWIVMYAGQLYDIQSIAEIGYHEGLQILARARQP